VFGDDPDDDDWQGSDLVSDPAHDGRHRSGRVEGGDENSRAHGRLLPSDSLARHATDRPLVFDPDLELAFDAARLSSGRLSPRWGLNFSEELSTILKEKGPTP